MVAPKVAPPTALNWPAMVVDALMASEPLVVALPKSVLPVSVVDAMIADRLALSCPPIFRMDASVVEALTANVPVDVAPVNDTELKLDAIVPVAVR